MSEPAGETCGATAQHPQLDLIGCELPAGHDGPHQFDPHDDNGVIEWDDEPAGAGFDIEAFVKALPEGVVLCPLCIGQGAVVEEPPFDPTTHMCATCQGRGRVRTGSLKSDQAERDCATCNGHGWLHNDASEPPAAPARSTDFVDEVKPRDHAGRTPDDPDFDWTRIVQQPEPAPEPEPVA